MNNRQLFLQHIGQTSTTPMLLEISKAKGNYLYGTDSRKYIDMIGGISVCNVGHGNPRVIKALKQQADQYMHVMVNGELVLTPQTAYAKLLTDHLPDTLSSVFFTASGSEATEGAMKLAKRYTGRTKIAAFNKSYHGSTQGSMSIIGDEYWRNSFRPLLPGIIHLDYNSFNDLEQIDTSVACVIAETVQAEAGVIAPDKKWLQALRKKCYETGTLLVLDEIQCGFGRNGSLFAFTQYDVVPDILLLGKALGGGMPLGAFISSKTIMDSFTDNPVLGHMNTFGGHPVCCAAGKAAMEFLLEKKLVDTVKKKERLFLRLLKNNPEIKAIRSKGLMIALEFESDVVAKKRIGQLIEKGLFTDWFLFAPNCIRLAPPLTITLSEIRTACSMINEVTGAQ
ncbi:MAG: aspartate aminotransferase family protein [Chitinophagaceae bacterium]|nr:aspartate aminotransferase family protein [Chitinophagaceae bacterium]